MEDLNTIYSIETILQLKPEMQPFLGRNGSEETAQVMPFGLLPTLIITLFNIPQCFGLKI